MKLNYFNFKPFGDQILLTNDLGHYAFVSQSELKAMLKKATELPALKKQELSEKGFLYDDTALGFSGKQRFELRERKGYTSLGTSLHIFVVTTACNAKCVYCQANNGGKHVNLAMDTETAQKAVDIALQSPSRYLSFEFQGGEPLLNYDVIRDIILYAEAQKGHHVISYNLVSNLTMLTDDMLSFFQQYHVGISTSIDGPELLHDANRPFRTGGGTFRKTAQAIARIRQAGLPVGAIQTTTRVALLHPKEIVRTYQELGFDSIFIRPLTPLGKATKNWGEIGYSPEAFSAFYAEALEEIIRINKSGYYLRENHASILLSKIGGAFVNYMELRSPCGASLGQLAYYADGRIFTCDEGRMLAEMGDSTFQLGDVFNSSYAELVHSEVCKAVCSSSTLESIPSCCDCVYQPYCGTCPVVSYAASADIIEKSPRSYRCRIYSDMLDFLFGKILENDPAVMQVFKAWEN